MGKRKGTAIQQATKLTGFDVSLQEMMNGLEEELLIIDNEYRIKFANLAAGSRLHKGVKSLISRYCYEVLQGSDKPCCAPLWGCPLKKVLQSGDPATIIHPEPAPVTDAVSNKYVKLTMYPFRDSYGNIDAVVELRRDVTAERELEIEILRRHHQLGALNQISSAISGPRDLDGILNIAMDTVLRIVNGAIGGILLLDGQTQRLSYRVSRGLSAKYVEEMSLGLGEGIAGNVAQTREPILLEDVSKDSRVARLDLMNVEGLGGFISVPLMAKDKIVGVLSIASHTKGRFTKDEVHLLESIGYQLGIAIEQIKLYQRLDETRERYQRLLQHTLTAREAERKRIARELHDETSQSLTGLTLNLQAIVAMAELIGVEDAEFKERLNKTLSLAIETHTEIGRLINELRPTLLDSLGLVPAIRQYADTNLRARGVNVSVRVKGMDKRLPSEVEVVLFRVTQEAINNIARHSEARNATINLECDRSDCILRIEDDGKGFNVQGITQIDERGRGAGLFSMKERVTLVGGACAVESRPGYGTKATVKVPYDQEIADAKDKSANSG